MTRRLTPEPLTRDAFAPFGDVIEVDGAEQISINEGTTDRFHDLAEVDVEDSGGRPLINIFRGRPRPLPIAIKMMERHPMGSQAFIPMDRRPYLVVVAPAEAEPSAEVLRAFLATGKQGVNYRRGVWHHPLLVLDRECDFLVVDRGGGGDNCDEVWFPAGAETAELSVD